MYLYMQPLLNDVVNGFNGSRIGVDEITSCEFIHEVCACVRACVCVCVCVCGYLSFLIFTRHILTYFRHCVVMHSKFIHCLVFREMSD